MGKKLFRKNEGKKIFGVCTGLAEYFNTDVTIIRILTAASCCIGGSGFMLYVLAAILMPEEKTA